MTYEQFKKLNDKIKQSSNNSIFSNVLHIDSVDFETNTCILQGKKCKISNLIDAIGSAQGCVTNPSILKNWKGFYKITGVEYLGYHFKPLGQVPAQDNAMKFLGKCVELNGYSYTYFYQAMNNSKADIFLIEETNQIVIPGNRLYLYTGKYIPMDKIKETQYCKKNKGTFKTLANKIAEYCGYIDDTQKIKVVEEFVEIESDSGFEAIIIGNTQKSNAYTYIFKKEPSHHQFPTADIIEKKLTNLYNGKYIKEKDLNLDFIYSVLTKYQD